MGVQPELTSIAGDDGSISVASASNPKPSASTGLTLLDVKGVAGEYTSSAAIPGVVVDPNRFNPHCHVCYMFKEIRGVPVPEDSIHASPKP